MSSIKLAYAAAVNHTITLASLASDTNLLAGRAGTFIDNTINLYDDYLLSGFVTTGTSPTTAREIDIYVYAALDDAPTYPNGITGTDANKTITTANILNSGLKLAAAIATSSTSNETSPFGPISIASLFGGIVPKRFGIFVVHNTAVALNATPANHQITTIGVYSTVVP